MPTRTLLKRDAQIPNNGVEEDPQVGTQRQIRRCAHKIEDRFLKHVLGELGIIRMPHRLTRDPIAMTFVKDVKGILLAVCHALDQDAVVYGHGRWSALVVGCTTFANFP